MRKFSQKILSLLLTTLLLFTYFTVIHRTFAEENKLSVFDAWKQLVIRLHELGAPDVPDINSLSLEDEVNLWVVLRDKEEVKSLDNESLPLNDKLERIASLRKRQQAEFLADLEEQLGTDNLIHIGSNVHLINTLALRVPFGKVEQLASHQDIISLQSNDRYIPAPDENTKLKLDVLSRASFFSARQYRGEGQIIAVIDSGFDVNHQDMIIQNQDSVALTEAKITELKTTHASLKGKWYNIKFPYGYNYADNNDNLRERKAHSHGTHVAGIAAGHGPHTGKSPEAQVLAMRVFSDSFAGTTPQLYSKAIEDALLLGAKTINMSLGSSNAIALDISRETLTAIAQAKRYGVVVNIASGNDGHTNFGTHSPKADNPHYATIATPAIIPDSLAVASLNSNKTFLPVLLSADRTEYSYSPSSVVPIAPHYDREYDLVDIKKGKREDIEGMPANALAGKVALIERGEIFFSEKIDNAASLGAVYAIIYNSAENGDADFGMAGIDRTTIPSLTLKRSYGLALKNSNKVTVTKNVKGFDYPEAGKLSDFSAWGPSAEFDLKPEITGIGGSVYAAQPDNKYSTDSGTSMAAPYVASHSAILEQRLRQDDTITLPVSFESSDLSALAVLKKNILMSTAKPYREDENTTFASPRKQGAGLVDADGLNSTVAYVTAKKTDENAEVYSKVNLGSVNNTIEFTVTIHNISKTKTVSFKPSATISTDKLDASKPNYIIPIGVQKIADDYAPEETLTIAPGGTQDWTVRFDYSARVESLLRDFINGFYVEGFVRLKSLTEGQLDIGLPWIGFHGIRTENNQGGSFKDLPPFEKSIYDYPNLSVDAPIYYHDEDSARTNPFTSLITGINARTNNLVVLGETTPVALVNEEGAANVYVARSFDKDKIAISPNGDLNHEFAAFKGVFTTPFVNAYIEILDSNNQSVYRSTPIYNGTVAAFVGRKADVTIGKPETLQSRTQFVNEWVWDAQRQGARPISFTGSRRFRPEDLVPDGRYTFIFHAQGHNQDARPHKASFPIFVDRVAPVLHFVSRTSEQVVVRVEETGSAIREVVLEQKDNRGQVIKSRRLTVSETNQVIATIPEAERDRWFLRATDIASNRTSTSLAALVSEAKGSFAYELRNQEGQNIVAEDDEIEVTLEDSSGRIITSDNWSNLVPGSYTATIDIKTLKYTIANTRVNVEVVAGDTPSKAIFTLQERETFEISLHTALFPIEEAREELANVYFNATKRDENITTRFNLDGVNTTSTPVFEGVLIPGEWTFELKDLPSTWIASPQTFTATVEDNGKFSFKDNIIIFKAPGMEITPNFTIEGEGDLIDETAISWSAYDGSIEYKDIDVLPVQERYIITPVVPEGYSVEPDTYVLTENRAGIFTPEFKVTKLTDKTKGRIVVNTVMKDASVAKIKAEYYAFDINGNILDDLDEAPYGTWYVKPLSYQLPSYVGSDEFVDYYFNAENYTTETELVKVVINKETTEVEVDFIWEALENPNKPKNNVFFTSIISRRQKNLVKQAHPEGLEFELESLLTHSKVRVKHNAENTEEAFDRFTAMIGDGYYKVTPVLAEGFFAYPAFQNIRFEDGSPSRVVFQIFKGQAPAYQDVNLVDVNSKLKLKIPTKSLHQSGVPYDASYFEFPVTKTKEILQLEEDTENTTKYYASEVYDWNVYYLEKGANPGSNSEIYNHGMDLFMEQNWTLSLPIPESKYGDGFKVFYVSQNGLGRVELLETEYTITGSGEDKTVDIMVKKGGKYIIAKELIKTISFVHPSSESQVNELGKVSLKLINPLVSNNQEYELSLSIAGDRRIEVQNWLSIVKNSLANEGTDAPALIIKPSQIEDKENSVVVEANVRLLNEMNEAIDLPNGVRFNLTFPLIENRTLERIVHIKADNSVEIFHKNNWLSSEGKVNVTSDSLSPFVLIYEPVPVTKEALATEITTSETAKTGASYKNATTDAKRTTFDTALEAAKRVNGDQNATQAQVDEARTNLATARQALDGRPTNKEALETEITTSETAKTGASYKNATTDAKRTTFDTALTEAKRVNGDENATQAQVDEARTNLATARQALDGRPTNKSTLEQIITGAEAVQDRHKYYNATEDKKNAFIEALNEANRVYDEANVTQAEVDVATNRLSEKMQALDGNRTDKQALEAKITEAEGVKSSVRYTNEETASDKSDFDNALGAAKLIKDKANASQKEVDKTLADLRVAVEKLDGREAEQPQPQPPIPPQPPVVPNKPEVAPKKEEVITDKAIYDFDKLFNEYISGGKEVKKEKKDHQPQTGTKNTNVILMAMILSLATVVMSKLRKNN